MLLLPLLARWRVLFRDTSRSVSMASLPSVSTRGRSTGAERQGLILGVFASEEENGASLFTSAGDAFDKRMSGKLNKVLTMSGPPLKKGKTRIFHGLHQDFSSIVVVGLGKKGAGINALENWDEDKENIRTAVSVGCKQVQNLEVTHVEVDNCGDAQAAAEGAILGLFEYDEFKQKKKPVVEVQLYGR